MSFEVIRICKNCHGCGLCDQAAKGHLPSITEYHDLGLKLREAAVLYREEWAQRQHAALQVRDEIMRNPPTAEQFASPKIYILALESALSEMIKATKILRNEKVD